MGKANVLADRSLGRVHKANRRTVLRLTEAQAITSDA